MIKPYQKMAIADCGEPLVPIPDQFWKIQPHPYVSLGAPYGDRSPFFVRQGILTKLHQAQAHLQTIRPDYQIAIFDAYRPIPVQQFMVDHSFTQLATSRGLSIHNLTASQTEALMAEVIKFWALPSDNPQTPPPHSTGAAIDVTLYRSSAAGIVPVDMGSPIDEISDRSLPDYFATFRNAQAVNFQRDRDLLNQAMNHSGFVRHPHEWWHFSYGDQLWAWLNSEQMAIYGRTNP